MEVIMEIGNIYRFDYESASKNKKEYEEPVIVKLTESKIKELIDLFVSKADESNKNFNDLKKELESIGFFKNLEELERMDQARKARSARAHKTEEQKNLEIIIEGQYDAYIKKFAPKDEKVKEKSIVDLFFRNYSASGITLSDTGKVEAMLVNKTFTTKGKESLMFITLSPIKVDQSSLYQLKDFEYV